MIHRSGSSARSRLPTSAATSRTWATSALSSVSGMVKNCGAWGSMAPPITVDIMVVLLGGKGIAQGEERQARVLRRLCRGRRLFSDAHISGVEKAALIAWTAFLFAAMIL